jgi:HEAT repeat protein
MVSDGDFHARFAAVKTLARARELENVPALIYALSDPDKRVMLEAREGLRFISRRFYGFGLPDNPSKAQVQTAQDNWKAWYLSIRPDAELLE